MAINVAYVQELINCIEICPKLYIKNLVTTPKSMTNASRENSILRFQPFALRLQIQMQNESFQEGNTKPTLKTWARNAPRGPVNHPMPLVEEA